MHEDVQVESLQGRLLIANGSLFGEEFRQTVILMAEHNEEGALGFVLNRPSAMEVELDSSVAQLPLIETRVYSGGPVQQEAVTVVAEFESPLPAAHIVFGSVGLPRFESDQAFEGIARAKVFAGYSGWGAGQLEGEIETGSWIVEPASVDVVFDMDPDNMWREVLRKKGGEYALLSTMPYDPLSN